jgi:hypothetical protein
MVKEILKSTINFYSNLTSIELIEKMNQQFESFELIKLKIKRTNDKYSPTFEYQITFYHETWINK